MKGAQSTTYMPFVNIFLASTSQCGLKNTAIRTIDVLRDATAGGEGRIRESLLSAVLREIAVADSFLGKGIFSESQLSIRR